MRRLSVSIMNLKMKHHWKILNFSLKHQKLQNVNQDLRTQKQHKEAIEYCDKALLMDPTDIEVLCQKIGSLFIKLKYQIEIFKLSQVAEAYQLYDRVMKIKSKNNQDILCQGKIIKYFRETFKQIFQGIIIHEMEKYKEAIELFDKVILYDPDCWFAISLKGSSLQILKKKFTIVKLKKYEEAIIFFDSAIGFMKSNKSFLFVSKIQFAKAQTLTYISHLLKNISNE